MVTFKDFQKFDIRVGEIVDVREFPEAKNPAYLIWVDFGENIGIKKSSAQFTELYSPKDLMGKQIMAVLNFPPKNIAGFLSEILILGIYNDSGVILIEPERSAKKGDKVG